MSLDQLISNCKKKQPQAQTSLYKKYAPKLYGICVKYAPNYTEAEDILQDAFITIFEKIGQFKNKGSFEGWLKRITINIALQRYRKKSHLNIVDENNIEEVEVEIDEDEYDLDYLLALIQELPNRYRLVFNMYVLDGFTHKEIAEALEITIGTSKSNLARARNILKEKLNNSTPLQQTQVQ